MTPEQKQKLLEQLEALKIFPNNSLVRELRKEITHKLKRAEKQKIPIQLPKKEIPNTTRSSKLKKYHRYLRMIRDNFPNLKYSDIRKQFSIRKKQGQSDIPDVVWQNPSP